MHRTGHESLPITLLYGHAEDALRAADVGIVASGTATLEVPATEQRLTRVEGRKYVIRLRK